MNTYELLANQLKWEDGTSYSRSDREKVPRTWVTKVGDFRLTVTRNIHDEGCWYGRCYPLDFDRRLDNLDLEGAKAELLTRLVAYLKPLLDALGIDA